MSERNWPDTIEVDSEALYQIMTNLRHSVMYLSPPEDWKPHKWWDKDEFAAIVYNCYVYVLKEMSEQTGGDYKGRNPLPFDTPPSEMVEYFTEVTSE